MTIMFEKPVALNFVLNVPLFGANKISSESKTLVSQLIGYLITSMESLKLSAVQGFLASAT